MTITQCENLCSAFEDISGTFNTMLEYYYRAGDGLPFALTPRPWTK